MLLVLVQRGYVIDIGYLRRAAQRGHANAHKAFGLELFQPFGVRALLQLDDGRHEHDARTFGIVHDVRDDLVLGAGLDGRAAVRAVDLAQAGKEDPQKVIDLGHRAYRGAGIVRRGLLLQGNGRRKPFDLVHQGLVHLGQEHACVGGKRFHVAALPFGIDDVEGQRGLAGTGWPADHHELVARDVHADVLEVVLACAGDADAGAGFGELAEGHGVIRRCAGASGV